MAKLAVCGAINWDVSCFVEHLPAPGEEVTVRRVTQVSGGTGGNIAVAAARILEHGQVVLIGAVGEDDIASRQLADLSAEGVITGGIARIPGIESGQAYILVDQEGQNVIASCLGANASLRLECVSNPPVKRLLHECQSMIITDPPLDVVSELIKLAGQWRIPVLWDPGILVSRGWEELKPLVKLAEILFLNEAEATALFGAGQLDVVLRCLRSIGFAGHVVLKLGTQGAAMLEPSTSMVTEASALPLKGLGLEAINTVGCGDVFGGVFAAYHVLGASLQESFTLASIAAGLNATRPETRGSPGRAALEAMEQRSRNSGFMLGERKLLESN